MAMIFLGSMLFDEVMRYAMPIENKGDGKAALEKATSLPDDVESGVLNEALRSTSNDE